MQINYQALYEANCAIIAGLEISNKKLQETNAEQQLNIDSLRLQLDQLKRMIFSSKQERFIPHATPDQLALPLDIETPAQITTTTSIQKISYDRVTTKTEKTPTHHPGRTKLPDHLQRQEIFIEPTENISGMKKIGEEITEELEYEPGKLFVKKYIRPKYVNIATEKVVIAPMIDRPLPKCIAGAGLLTQLLIDKYVDHLPIYRICERFKREGVNINYNTMIDWVGQAIQLIQPLYEALKKKVLSSGYIHADETGLKVLDKDKKGSTHQGWLWAYLDSVQNMALFDYQPTRGRAAPYELLKNFEGYLQVDGYSAYDIFTSNKKITILYCMAHSRRKFFDAQQNDADRSAKALDYFQKLYTIERTIKEQNLSMEHVLIERQKAKPILDEFHQWMKNEITQVIPKSPIGLAISYTLERWDGLCIYITNPKLNIDNNPVENSIRPIAIGRKNYLFAGSHEAAQRTAVLYSLMATCKLNDINPAEWLKNTLIAIPNHPINRIEELLPIKKI
jgi:transposase